VARSLDRVRVVAYEQGEQCPRRMEEAARGIEPGL
jgi:hypothetical protein